MVCCVCVVKVSCMRESLVEKIDKKRLSYTYNL